jgi:methylmalonyl-CoA mutase
MCENRRRQLLEIAVDAARNRATLGEIRCFRNGFGRYKAQIQTFSGVYSKEIKDLSKALKKQNN